MKVFSDLLLAADSGEMSATCLLGLTAAFDTADYDVLLLPLECQFSLGDSTPVDLFLFFWPDFSGRVR